MEDILKNVWLQAGAFGLLAASGWFIWWQEHKERKLLQDKYDALLERLLSFMNSQKDTVDKLSEGFAIQALLRDEFNKYRDSNERKRDG